MKQSWPDELEVLKLLPDYDALLGKLHIDSKFLDAAGAFNDDSSLYKSSCTRVPMIPR